METTVGKTKVASYTARRVVLNISRYPFPRNPWGGEGTGAPPLLKPGKVAPASHSLIDIRPGGAPRGIYCRGALGAFGMFHWGEREAGLEHDQTG